VPAFAVGDTPKLSLKVRVDAPGALAAALAIRSTAHFDPVSANDSASAILELPEADLTVSESTDPPQAVTGVSFNEIVRVSNAGPDAASNVSVMAAVPAGLTFVSATATSGSYDPSSGIWRVANVAVGGSETLTLTEIPLASGTVQLTASKTGEDQYDLVAGNDSSSGSLVITDTPQPPAPAAGPPSASGPTDQAAPTVPPTPPVSPPADKSKAPAAQASSAGSFDPLSHPAQTLGAAAAGVAALSAAGAAAGAAGAASGAASGAAGGAAKSGGGEGGGEGRTARVGSVRIQAEGGNAAKVAPGDASVTWRAPGHTIVDAIGVGAAVAVARRSTLGSTLVIDGAPLRAAFGSLWTLGAIGAGIAGVVAAESTEGAPAEISLTLFCILIFLGMLDAVWGAVGASCFVLAMIVGGVELGRPEVVLMLGLSSTWVSVSLIVGKIRPLRRPPATTTHDRWVRAGDLVVFPLIAAWLAVSLLEVLPSLSGEELPLDKHMTTIQLVVVAAVMTRLLLEMIAAHWYPMRLARNLPGGVPKQEVRYAIPSILFRTALMIWVTFGLLGDCWQLYVAAFLFALGEILPVIKHRFPKFPKVQQALPRDLVKIVFVLVLVHLLQGEVKGHFGEEGHEEQILRWGFLLALTPALFCRMLETVIPHAHAPTNWSARFAGVGIVAVFAALSFHLITIG
jgi:uncharacterized repeat protein (TIGR01451 family)